MDAIEAKLIDLIRNVYGALSWPGVVLLMAIESACIPLPSELIMPLAGWFLVQDTGYGVEWVFLLAALGALGNVIGSWVAYAAGATGGRTFLERWGKYLLISRHDLDLVDRWFAKYGEAVAFFSRLLPVVRTFISFPAGVARMNLAKFTIFTFLGAYPFCLGLAYGGYKLGEHWEKLRNGMRPFDIPIIIVFLLLLALYVWRHYRRAWAKDS